MNCLMRSVQFNLDCQSYRSAMRQDNTESKLALCSPLMSKGEVHSAISLITEHDKGGILELSSEVREHKKKTPKSGTANSGALIQGELPTVNSILFECLTSDFIRKTALRTRGTANPSMADADIWRRMLLSFKSASKDLCDAVAEVE